MRSGIRTRTDTSGRVARFGLAPGGHVIYASARDRLPATVPLVVPGDSAVEVLISMESQSAPGAKRLITPLADLQRRVRYARTSRAVLVPWQELAGHGSNLGDTLQYSLSLLRSGLRLDDGACIYVNGRPQPNLTVYEIDPSEVTSVEIYGMRALFQGTLAPWPEKFPCGNPHGATREMATPRTGLQAG